MTSFDPLRLEHGVGRGGTTDAAEGTTAARHPAEPRRRTPRRDRHGRGLRGPLLPAGLPAALTRQEAFEGHLAAAVSRLAEVCGPAVEEARFRATLIPDDLEARLESVRVWGAEMVDDPTGSTRRDDDGTAVITIHRRPLEARCPSPSMLPDLVYATVVEQWAELTGLAPEAVDPDYLW